MASVSPKDEQIKQYYDFALSIVMKCGSLFLEGYNKVNTSFEVKTDYYDLVTEYDKQIEKTLIEELQKAFPESKFIGEEGTSSTQVLTELTNKPTWIIDPIDGTTNFINKIPHCCISVGLAINKELVVGIIYNPVTNEMYSARKGCGAYLNGERLHVSKVTSIKDAVIGYEMSLIQVPSVCDKHLKRLCKLASNGGGTRGVGSAALNLCYVAKGSFHCFHVEDLKPWDIAAGAVIVTEAGGLIKHTSGKRFSIMKPDLICACSDELFKDVQNLINAADQIKEYIFS